MDPQPFNAALHAVRPGGTLAQSLQASGSALEQAACKALDIAGVAIVVVDTRGRVQQFNSLAKGRLRSGPLRLVGGRLAGANELDTRRLRDAIRWTEEAQAMETRNVPLSASHQGGVQQVVVAPLQSSSESAGPQLALVLLAKEAVQAQSAVPPVHLTEAEFRLLKALVAGERLGAYAARSGVKLSTVKTHLQSLFDKFGERRQTDLVRRAMCDPVLRQKLAPVDGEG
jgi:DNA-binding CsgD family transcriptional regulator